MSAFPIDVRDRASVRLAPWARAASYLGFYVNFTHPLRRLHPLEITAWAAVWGGFYT
jgi:hypothetical protein